MKKENKKETEFFGEHAENNIWSALINPVRDTDYFVRHIKYVAESGEGITIAKTEINGEEYTFAALDNERPLRVLLTLKGKEIAYCAPLLRGINIPAIIKEKYTWKKPYLGEFAVKVGENEHIMSIFDPLYAIDSKQNIKKEIISLSAVALRIKKFEEKSFTVDKGGFYEMELEKFLKENPGKTKKDFEDPILRMTPENFRMIMPTKYTSEQEIVAGIDEVQKTTFLGQTVYIMKANLEHTINNEFCCFNLYASKEVLLGYVPKAGDAISAVVWLQGFFN